MAQIESWFDQDLKKPVKVHHIPGNVFTQDNEGNLVGVRVFDHGEEVTLSGSVSANVIRPDGGTVAVSGTLSGNQASVSLPQAAYAYPGMIAIVIKLTSGTTVTTLCAVTAIVYRSSTDAIIDPGTIIPDIQALIAQIDAAVTSIPPDYSALTAEVGSLKSAIKNLAVDDYVGTQTFYAHGNFVNYGLDTTTGQHNTSRNRVSNDDPMTFDRDIRVSVKSGFRWGYVPFVGGVAGTWSGWQDSRYTITIPSGTSFVVLIARSTDDLSEVADVVEFTSKVTFETLVGETVNKLSINVSGLDNALNYVDYFDDLINGSLNTTTGAVNEQSQNRCTNKNVRTIKENITVTAETGYSIYILEYLTSSVSVLSTWVSSYTVPAGKKVRFMVKKNTDANLTPAEARTNTFGQKSIIEANVKRLNDLEDKFSNIVNLFDGEWEQGSLENDGSEITGSGAYRTDFIPVEPNTLYTLQNEVGGVDPYFVGLIIEYTANKAYVTRHSNTGASPYSFTTSSTTAYIRFRTKDTASVTLNGAQNAKYMLHLGSGTANYLSYGAFEMSEGFTIKPTADTFGAFNLLNSFTDYKDYAKSNDGSEGSRFDADALTAADVYSAYDALVSAYSSYIKKTDLGMDESGTYHIYQYTFTPPSEKLTNSSTGTTLDDTPHCLQKIIITSGTHGNSTDGDHTDSIISVYNLMNILCNGYQSDPMLSYLRNNVQFIVIPCVNPWGVTNESRYNSNGVDINRNFNAGWSSGDHRGSSAASEAETQIMQTLFNNNLDAFAHVEVHTRGGNTWAQTQTTFTSEVSVNSVLRFVMQSVVGYLKQKFIASGAVNVDINPHGMIIDYSNNVSGIPSVLLECAFMASSSETGMHSKATDLRNTEFVIDTVYRSLQWFFTHNRFES